MAQLAGRAHSEDSKTMFGLGGFFASLTFGAPVLLYALIYLPGRS